MMEGWAWGKGARRRAQGAGLPPLEVGGKAKGWNVGMMEGWSNGIVEETVGRLI
jgi:hypothetical protein